MNSKGVTGDDEPDNREQLGSLRVQFVLPKGAYATTVLANAFDLIDGSRETDDPRRPSTSGTPDTEDGIDVTTPPDAKAEEE